MIPIELTLKGIYSYQSEQVIDFRKLAEGRLFGLFGAVGSGKSTILEAMTLALYDQTERLGKSDNRYYNLMNLKSDELLVRFIFRAGQNLEREFLAEVSGRRRTKDFEKVARFDRRLLHKNDAGDWEPVEESIEEIIGLDYDNFRRTVIIPQGKFQEFLQLTSGNRTQMLKTLFNLERFDLQGNTSRLISANDAEIQHLKGQLQELQGADAGQLEKMKKQLAGLRKNIEKQLKSFSRLADREQQMQAAKMLLEKIEAAENEYNEMKSREKEIRKQARLLEEFQDCSLTFKSLLEQRNELRQRSDRSAESLVEKQAALAALEKNYQNLAKAFADTEKRYRNREKIQQVITDLETIKSILSRRQQQSEIDARIAGQDQQLSHLDEQLRQALANEKAVAQKIAALRAKMPSREVLEAIAGWRDIQQNFDERLTALQEAERKCQQDIEELDGEKNTLLTVPELSRWISPIERRLPVEVLQEQLAKAAKELEREAKAVDAEWLEAQTGQHLAEMAGKLTAGEPCPICGALEHPHPLEGGPSRAALKKIAKKREALLALRQTVDDVSGQLALLQERLSILAEHHQATAKEIATLRQKAGAHLRRLFPDSEGATEALPEPVAFISDIQSQQADMEALTEQQQHLSEQHRNSQQQLAEARQASEADRQQQNFQQAHIAALQENLKVLKFEKFAGDDSETISERLAAEQHNLAEVLESYEEQQQQLRDRQKNIDQLNGEIKALRGNVAEQKENLTALSARIKDELQKSSYTSLKKVEAIMMRDHDIAAEKQAIENFNAGYRQVRQHLKSLRKDLQGRKYDSEKHRECQAEKALLQEKIDQGNRDIGGLEKEIAVIAEKLEVRGKVEERLKALTERADYLAMLRKLFHGSGFVNFISTIFLKNLCQTANVRFRALTRQRLQLEVADNNQFQVRDFLNNGQVRSVKTLSGGQTFQASLSLALALADNIQQLADLQQNFFFLDEGFGTLDRESLAIVFNTLKELRKENRVVGVISHVEALKQEIDMALYIENDEENGSRIKTSWQ